MKKSYQAANMLVLFDLKDDILTASTDNLVKWNNDWDTELGGGENGQW